MNLNRIVIISIIAFSFILAVSLYLSPCFPEKVASHWNIAGQVDGYLPKFWGLFLMPLLSLALFLLFILIPKIDPLKENIEKFRKYYNGFIVLIMLFFFCLYILTIAWNIGLRFNMGQSLVPAFAILFYYTGILVENSKRNWFVGIRTPWTMHSDAVWEKTHKLGGKLFKVTAVIAALGLFFPKYAFWLVIVPVICLAFVPVIYSYFEYQKESKR
jgi:uncharacterized membrane protein